MCIKCCDINGRKSGRKSGLPMQRLIGSPSPSQSATAHQQFMLTFGHQKERLADINTKLVLDEATRQRWEKISGFVRGMFDLSRDISSWLSRELFVEYYTY